MEFRFNVNPLFRTNIISVDSNLVPVGYAGTKRDYIDASARMSDIINEMGAASAEAQGLNKPVTTAQKLRNSDHKVYLLSERLGKNGSVTGLLKVGVKNLYVFDQNGETQVVNSPCVLDFYIHESRQRAGLGKILFEAMLEQEKYVPHKMAIDRPSEKLIGFLRKHYGLTKNIPQMNNFVVYEGFFGDSNYNNNNANTTNRQERRMQLTNSPNSVLFGPQFVTEFNQQRTDNSRSPNASSNLLLIQQTPMGRYGAPRPTCSMAEMEEIEKERLRMAQFNPYYQSISHQQLNMNPSEPNQSQSQTQIPHQEQQDLSPSDVDSSQNVNPSEPLIIHNSSTPIAAEPNSRRSQDDDVFLLNDTVDGNQYDKKTIIDLVTDDEEEQKPNDVNQQFEVAEPLIVRVQVPVEEMMAQMSVQENGNQQKREAIRLNLKKSPPAAGIKQIIYPAPVDTVNSYFHHSKQHTGRKNLSFNVGAAVSPTGKMEFNQEEPEDFGIVKITHPVSAAGIVYGHDTSDIHSVSSNNSTGGGGGVGNQQEGLTDHGYFDLKFHHNKLW